MNEGKSNLLLNIMIKLIQSSKSETALDARLHGHTEANNNKQHDLMHALSLRHNLLPNFQILPELQSGL